jgi:hypothetical protein
VDSGICDIYKTTSITLELNIGYFQSPLSTEFDLASQAHISEFVLSLPFVKITRLKIAAFHDQTA